MNLPHRELLSGSHRASQLLLVVKLAERVLKTWQPAWTPFLDAPLLEEALHRLSSLAELSWHTEGGYESAERRRLLCCCRHETEAHGTPPIKGLRIEGNFLFDPVTPDDLRAALIEMGLEAGDIGDLWVCGDRGGQGVLTSERVNELHGRRARIREAEILCEAVELQDLRLPAQRLPRYLTTVEASRRLDAIASAGFKVSRSKAVALIKKGCLRLNWGLVGHVSHELKVGDRMQLRNQGTLEVLAIERTKRDRWRIELLRS